jgi:hypothetical protein
LLHPTIIPLFNTAIAKGFNALFKENRKLGSWKEYLAVLDNFVNIQEGHSRQLSMDPRRYYRASLREPMIVAGCLLAHLMNLPLRGNLSIISIVYRLNENSS